MPMAAPEIPSLANEDWIKDVRFKTVMEALRKAGGEALAVGGCVRDALLGQAASDIDVATTLTPDAVVKAGTKAGLGVHLTGEEHGTITLVAGPEGERKAFEVTTLRVDSETFGRHARVSFTAGWQEDAQRRDFTMNALYCDANGNVHDLVGGYKDLRARTVRFVGTPENRIQEDYLRILRFYRFHARFGEGAPDTAGRAACKMARAGLDTLSRERMRQEFFKLLVAPGAVSTILLMEEDGVLAHILPGAASVSALENLAALELSQNNVCDPFLRLMALYPNLDAAIARTALVLTNDEMKRLKAVASAPPVSPRFRPAELDRLLYWFGNDTIIAALLLAWAGSSDAPDDEAWRVSLVQAQNWVRPEFPLSGNDLQALGIEEGPELGKQLQALEDYWVAAEFVPERDVLLARLKDKN